ncbi:MAG: pyridoxal-phosphate-dependent aminotransferase family protein [bacterium]
MQKKLLLSPGPTPVPSEALLAMAQPIIHHRTPEFTEILNQVQEGLKYLFQTEQDVLIIAGSGTAAMEASVSNILSPGDKAICIRGGKFGERWADLCTAYGVNPINIDVEWGKALDPKVLEDHLSKNTDVKAVYATMSETSTGVRYDIEAFAKIVSRHPGTVLVVDAITAVGVMDVPMDKWGIDVLVCGSQKALMLPPGLAFISLSEKAWKCTESSTCPKYYLNLKKEKKNLAKGQTAYTPAVSLIVGLNETLKMIREEGLTNVFKRHATLAAATRAACQALGLELLANDSPSDAVTAVCAPEGTDASQIIKKMKGKYGMIIAGGQEHLKGKIFRIAHLGYFDKCDIFSAVAHLELSLKELGIPAKPGAGIAAAEQVFLAE